ncbi:MAG: UvrB/UvrC motif-containing protein [Candidatus Izemoplasmatales bacterium]
MKILHIKKNGKLLIENYESNNVDLYFAESLSDCLSCDIELDDGVLFETVFGLILKEKDFFGKVFYQELSGRTLDDLEKEMKSKKKPKENDVSLNFLEITKVFEFFSTEEKINTIDLYCVFVGIGKTKENIDVFIPTSVCPLNELKNVPVKLSKIVESYNDIPEDNEDDQQSMIEYSGDLSPSFKAITRISVYEFIQSIFYEICYYKKIEEKIQLRNIKDDKLNSQNKLTFLESQLSKHVENDEFEKAAALKKQIEKIKKAKKI